ncbi:MAG: glycosyltransferase family 2 protein [Chloroflexi bacterium]|nr:glycosyltransferase family 2 protein [Chloroflexota bacterium]
MIDQPHISLIIPAYNEVARIAQTIGEARDYFARRNLACEIIVAADGDDGTRERVAELARTDSLLTVIGSPERRGKGRGIRQAVARARGALIGFTDADNKTPIDEFAKFEPHLRAGVEVVIGSRGLRDSYIEHAQPFHRRIGSKGFAIFMHAVVGLNDIIDTQCGFKFFQRDVARDLFARQVIDGYMFDVEILYLAEQAGYRIVQVPVRWRDDGDSRLVLFGGNVRNALDVFRVRLRGARRIAALNLEQE